MSTSPRILMIDNYDSFTWNLVQYFGELGATLTVERNDSEKILAELRRPSPVYEAVVISPGPCTPNEAGVSLEVIAQFSNRIPLLGVCLGHQAIGQAFGGRVVRARVPMHGKISAIKHLQRGLFAGIPQPMQATRYHSLIVERNGLPDCLQIDAETDDGEIMALSHKTFPIWGVQFHPESIMTPDGHALLKNFLTLIGNR